MSIVKTIKGENRILILIDQATFSAFNFASIFILSKISSVEAFSDFVLFQSYVFFLFIFTTFLFASPILVLLNKYYSKKKEIYLSVLLWSNLLITAVLAIFCFIFLKKQGVSTYYTLVFGVPFLMSVFDIIKKYLFSSLSISLYHAIVASGLLSIVFFTSIYFQKNQLTLNSIIEIYLVSYAVATIYLIGVLLINKILSIESFKVFKHFGFIKAVINKHYTYSKWIILGGIAFWGYSQGLYIFSKELLVSDFGISKVKTTQNILGIVNILIISVENYYTPIFSKQIVTTSRNVINKLVTTLYKKYTLWVLSVLLAVFISAVLFYKLLYEVKYGNAIILLIFFTLAQLTLFLIRPLIIALKSLEITFPFFYAHLYALGTMLFAGYFIIRAYEYTGMVFTYFLSVLAFSITVYYYYIKEVNSFHKTIPHAN